MRRFVLRRFLYSIVTLFFLSVTIFVLVRMSGDPARLLAGPGAQTEDVEALRERLGLNRPYPVQYVDFVTNAIRLNFGTSFNFRVPVTDLYFSRLPNSLQLALAAMLVSLVVGIPAGIISAVKQGTIWDRVAKVIALTGMSVPGFFVGLLLILVFAVNLRVLPTSGQGTWQQLLMPALALGWYFAASMVRLTQSSMLDVLGSEYIKMARLKGVPERIVIVKHAFKNALIPVVTLAGVNFVVMLNTAIIIEVIFAWPGIGRLLYEGISQRDFPLVQGNVILAGVMIIVANFLIDILYAWIDPRIRVGR
ncbi:MAG TPA: ABC transporter permease [Dehalococcoidia bacterium]|nr:ABC transporter permease [Dehalococcoidia bacterium]